MAHMHQGVMAKPSAAFVPTSLPNLAGWWDASDASTFTYSSGVVVSEWRDKSGNARHVTQGVVANQPSRSGTVNGLSAVVFDGTNDSLATTDPVTATAQPQTVFAVAIAASLSGGRNILSGVATATTPTLATTGATATLYAGTSRSGGALSTSTTYVFQGTLNDASSSLRVNGGTNLISLSPGTNGYRGYQFGRYSSFSDFWNGTICEAVVYNSALSLTDINTVGQYLATKWGVTWTTAS